MALPIVVFFSFHTAPSQHFAQVIPKLSEREVYVCPTDLTKHLFNSPDVKIINPNSTEEISKICSVAQKIIVSIGSEEDVSMLENLLSKLKGKDITLYYDNPEPFVPLYSDLVARLVPLVKTICFANSNLSDGEISSSTGLIDTSATEKIGTGYYNTDYALKIEQLRADQQGEMREKFFNDNNLTALENPKIITYIGGNNEVYFGKALPAFIKFVEDSIDRLDLSNLCFNFHFHPGSKKEHKDKDLILELMEKYKTNPHFPKIFFSENLDNALILADTIFYHQTSMSPLFVLAGIKCAQVGHEAFRETLLNLGLINSITNSQDLNQYISNLSSEERPLPKEKIMKVLGIRADGLERFTSFITNSSPTSE